MDDRLLKKIVNLFCDINSVNIKFNFKLNPLSAGNISFKQWNRLQHNLTILYNLSFNLLIYFKRFKSHLAIKFNISKLARFDLNFEKIIDLTRSIQLDCIGSTQSTQGSALNWTETFKSPQNLRAYTRRNWIPFS